MTSEESAQWIRRFHPVSEAKVRLACFPYAGGAAGFYHPLSGLLSPEIEVLAVQYPGRQERWQEPAVEDIGVLADRAAAALGPYTGGPLALFGHSMGAVVAFEVARRLAADPAAAPLLWLFASGRRAPSLSVDERVHLLDDDGLVAEIESLGGTSPGLLADEELRRMVLPAVRADYRAIETYRCPADATPLTVPVTVLVGDSDPRVTVEQARAWSAHTEAATDAHVFPGGDHFYLSPHRAEVAEHVRRRLR
ncbi:thioesterase II family protein [Streptomyces sp. NPDC002514]|uniref:thioesterase II family protein n=1 Tax=Streptomyces sp. NPDC001270 TaxID=3364554 RepID=UPI0036C2D74F